MSDRYFNARLVKVPKVAHTCQACGKKITGQHCKVSGEYKSSFYNYHMHESCFSEMAAICGNCPKQQVCSNDILLTKCYRKYKNKGK